MRFPLLSVNGLLNILYVVNNDSDIFVRKKIWDEKRYPKLLGNEKRLKRFLLSTQYWAIKMMISIKVI